MVMPSHHFVDTIQLVTSESPIERESCTPEFNSLYSIIYIRLDFTRNLVCCLALSLPIIFVTLFTVFYCARLKRIEAV